MEQHTKKVKDKLLGTSIISGIHYKSLKRVYPYLNFPW
jgi:hypothetical protein